MDNQEKALNKALMQEIKEKKKDLEQKKYEDQRMKRKDRDLESVTDASLNDRA